MSDLIKRSDVWNITAILHSEFITIEQEQILERIDEMIDGLPSADRQQGEWKDRTYGGRILHPWWESCECSQCEEWGSGAWNFCPHCGARMKGADDE